jgi:hypothetical protein
MGLPVTALATSSAVMVEPIFAACKSDDVKDALGRPGITLNHTLAMVFKDCSAYHPTGSNNNNNNNNNNIITEIIKRTRTVVTIIQGTQ